MIFGMIRFLHKGFLVPASLQNRCHSPGVEVIEVRNSSLPEFPKKPVPEDCQEVFLDSSKNKF